LKSELVERLSQALLQDEEQGKEIDMNNNNNKRQRLHDNDNNNDEEHNDKIRMDSTNATITTTLLEDPEQQGEEIDDVDDSISVQQQKQQSSITELERLLDEYPDDDDFNVIAQGAQATSTTTAQQQQVDGEGGPGEGKDDRSVPAFRFSTLSTALTLRSTAEQEEALRVTGVTADNYWMKINPSGAMIEGSKKKAFEVNLDEVEHPKWRDPGAVISDFFNYGLNEQTWKEYAARQVALKLYRQQQFLNKSNEMKGLNNTSNSGGMQPSSSAGI
jgi:hypothetical protein